MQSRHNVMVALVVAASASIGLAYATAMAKAPVLHGDVAAAVVCLTDSGGARGTAWVLIAALCAWLLDRTVAWSARWRDTLRLFVVLAVVLPLVATVNEHWIKPAFEIARPSHERMAQVGILPEPAAFYALTPSEREALLHELTEPARRQKVAADLDIDERVLEVWIHETAATFPSGHAWNVFLAATLFACASLRRRSRLRQIVVNGLLCWAVAVAWSRVALWVHRPVDVAVGTLAGILLALLLHGSGSVLWRQRDAGSLE